MKKALVAALGVGRREDEEREGEALKIAHQG
jgi:hypothetical protein